MTRSGWLLTISFAGLVIEGLSFVHPTPRLIWNATASTPVGLYALRPVTHFEVSDLVSVIPPEPLASFLADGGYLPRGVPLLKRVAALPAQEVCRNDLTVTVDGIVMGEALRHDRRGNPLPAWQGCKRIASDEIFLMNMQPPDSLDGRYFGPIPQSSIMGRATPLLTDEEGDGRFEWRAPTR